ncbi:hypothetical protein [Spiroplasma platyhelix]|uniref:EamA domain-containing protein n=1 Tax=Spiroplasma platyhelix PALS-1 TaxID=1276218 RepID=A0A846TWK8_9MOLU|nr:hypothetical protein [Spiroplasma platyhelix]MBE4704040.1 hypothetical protein [Spiroplasma platyhelix PALS-1]NKE38411.1 hypothetical protein [Spiroplasma platyhelix PALS-1]UJB29298.1 hypothetical protein SPLAT_v1c05340 [Spiroplasma platyhelix PALS-1]
MLKKNTNFLIAGGFGISAAMFYSLTPLFVFFFASSSLPITYAIFLATIQEFMSFILVGIVIGFYHWKEIQTPKTYWMNYTLLIPFGYMFGVGIYSNFLDLINKLKNGRVWIMAAVGVLAGPISMSLLMIAALYLNDGTLNNVILNTAPIYCMILSRFVLKDKINNVGLIGIIITSLLTFGMLFNFFFIKDTIDWKAILGVGLSFIAALAYAIEGTVSDYFLHNNKLHLTNYEIVTVKSFVSFWIMLIIALPVASAIDSQPLYNGWTIFKTSFDAYGWQALLVYASGITMGTGRLLYFETVKLASGTYALATQLTMLIWTPVFQILGNLWIPEIHTDRLQWFYWLWAGLILLSLFIVTFNEDIYSWYLKHVKSKSKKHK